MSAVLPDACCPTWGRSYSKHTYGLYEMVDKLMESQDFGTYPVVCSPVVPGQLTAVPPAGGWGVVQAGQFGRHLLQCSSLGFTLTGEQVSLEDTKIRQDKFLFL